MTVKRIPTKQELLQLQKLYRTDKKIGQALGNVPEQLVAYWRRKKGVGKSIFPKYTQREIDELWERFGDDLKAGQELGITKQAFYRWRKKYKIFNRPAILRLEQLELRFYDEQRLNRSGEKVWPAQTLLQKVVSFHDPSHFPAVGQRIMVPVDLVVTIDEHGVAAWRNNSSKSSAGAQETAEHFESFAALFDGGHFRANQVIVSDRPEAAALAAMVSLVQMTADPVGHGKNLPEVAEIEVLPTVKAVFPSATPIRHNAFEAACRLLEAVREQAGRSLIIELSGPGIEGLGLDDRMSLIAYASFLTGRQVVIEPDQVFLNFLNHYGHADTPVPFSDKNASLLETITISLTKSRAGLFSLCKGGFVTDPHEFEGKQLRRVRIGPFLGGGIEDFRAVAQALRGEKVRKGLQLYLIPSSQAVFAEALRRRYVQPIVEAGGRVGNLCLRPPLPVLAKGEFELTTELDASPDNSYLTSLPVIVQSLRSGKISRRAFE